MSPLARSGTCSPSPFTTIVSPVWWPFSTVKATSLVSLTVLCPRHCWQAWALVFPLPPQVEHYVCIYIYIPKPIWTFCITTPWPLHYGHVLSLPSLAPVPLHLLQYIFLLIEIDLSLPLYISSKWMSISTLKLGPLLICPWPPSNLSTPSSPPWSYACLNSSFERTSYALLIYL